jgi:hypothetical protein
MSIIFTGHAIIKLKQRKINRQLVLETIKNPSLIRPTYGFREEFYRKFGGLYLKVVIKKGKKHVIVLTAHWVAKPRKKL